MALATIQSLASLSEVPVQEGFLLGSVALQADSRNRLVQQGDLVGPGRQMAIETVAGVGRSVSLSVGHPILEVLVAQIAQASCSLDQQACEPALVR